MGQRLRAVAALPSACRQPALHIAASWQHLVPPCLVLACSLFPRPRVPRLPTWPQKLTFLRMGDMMIDNWSAFGAFLQRLTCPPS